MAGLTFARLSVRENNDLEKHRPLTNLKRLLRPAVSPKTRKSQLSPRPLIRA